MIEMVVRTRKITLNVALNYTPNQKSTQFKKKKKQFRTFKLTKNVQPQFMNFLARKVQEGITQ